MIQQVRILNRVVLKCVPKKGTTFFQARVTYFRIVVNLKSREFWKKLEQTFQMCIITFLSLNWEVRYRSLKLTQCQNFLIKSNENRSKLFLQMVYWVNFDLKYLKKLLYAFKRSKTHHTFVMMTILERVTTQYSSKMPK